MSYAILSVFAFRGYNLGKDLAMLWNEHSLFPQIATVTAQGYEVGINALPLSGQTIVPLVLRFPIQGDCQLQFQSEEDDLTVHLIDWADRSFRADLTHQPYLFTAADRSAEKRYGLKIMQGTTTSLADTKGTIGIYAHQRRIHIAGAPIGSMVEIVNLQGQLVLQETINGASFSLESPVHGVVIVSVSWATGNQISKINIQ